MPLCLEVHKDGAWQHFGLVRAGDPPGSLSHNGPQGREIYSFTCEGDRSIIKRSIGGIDAEVGVARLTASLAFEVVDMLTPEHPDLEFWLRTDRMPEPVRFRFHHGAS